MKSVDQFSTVNKKRLKLKFEIEMYFLSMLPFPPACQLKTSHRRVAKTNAWKNQESECTCVMETIQSTFL